MPTWKIIGNLVVVQSGHVPANPQQAKYRHRAQPVQDTEGRWVAFDRFGTGLGFSMMCVGTSSGFSVERDAGLLGHTPPFSLLGRKHVTELSG